MVASSSFAKLSQAFLSICVRFRLQLFSSGPKSSDLSSTGPQELLMEWLFTVRQRVVFCLISGKCLYIRETYLFSLLKSPSMVLIDSNPGSGYVMPAPKKGPIRQPLGARNGNDDLSSISWRLSWWKATHESPTGGLPAWQHVQRAPRGFRCIRCWHWSPKSASIPGMQ